MQKTKLILMIGIISLLLISGCTKSSEKEVIRTDIHTGSDGLEFDFMQNLPMSKVYSGEEFQIGLRAINKGAYDMTNVIFKISGDPGYVSFNNKLSDSERISKIEGKTNYDPRDKEENIIFDAKSSFADIGFQEHDSLLIVSACYDYSNTLSTQICVDPDVYNMNPTEKNCQAGDKTFSGQGGPVGISKVETKMYSKNNALYPRFRITLTNFGPGEVITKGSGSTFCSSDTIKSTDLNSISISRLEFSDITLEDMDCIPTKDNIKFTNNQADITCTLKESSSKRLDANTDSYTTSLLVEINYGYSLSKSKTVTIIQANS